VAGFYDPLFDFIRQLVTEGFLNEKHLDSLLIESDPRRLLKRLSAYQLSSKWS
jgi:predicted Rossmann-fold nucleotide-binding protein